MIPEYIVKVGYFHIRCNISIYLHRYILPFDPQCKSSRGWFEKVWQNIRLSHWWTLTHSKIKHIIYLYICFWVRFLWLLHLLLLFGYVPCFLGVYSYLYVSLLPYPSFFRLEFTRRPMASGAGNGLGFFCFGSCRLACWSWNPVDGKDGSLLKQWEAVYVGYVLWWPSMEKRMPFFFCTIKWSCSGSVFFWGGVCFSCFFFKKYMFSVYFLVYPHILARWFPCILNKNHPELVRSPHGLNRSNHPSS